MTRVLDAILGLRGVAAYAVVGGLAFGEAALLIGLFLPGEVAVLLGGVLASQGQVSLPVMVAVASFAAVAGDSVGYEIGRRYGTRLLAWGPMRRHAHSVERANAYLRDRGGRAVFLGRWTGILRALVPGLAGMARMPYGSFMAYNVTGGVAWATVFVVLGYAGGASYRTVERVAGQASLLLLGLIALGFVLRWATRRAIARQDRLRALGRRVVETPPARWASGRYHLQLRWLADRLDPRVSHGLSLTVVVAALTAAGWAVGAIVQDLLVGEELALLDAPVEHWMDQRRTAVALTAARVVLAAADLPGATATTLLVAVILLVCQRRRAAVTALLAVAGAVGVAELLQRLLPVTAAGTRFPATATAVIAALGVTVIAAAGHSRGWVVGARTAGAAAMVVAVAGVAALVDGDTALSGALGGGAIGALWALALELPTRTGSAGPVAQVSGPGRSDG